ncbi:meiotic recombination protein REC114 isoform X1 [Scleropages formosus]|uniref:Meiotic recombination protein REC114-like n=1 Tax=Scleropages formosus TaxID=113540 RepID=A0A8C9S136_SCLFO|nr:meiotic recombination protein REC114 isoform X1 [Scleropages formosus]XP_018600782.1 meiotic recombination protein REC114 isoform X1 [Scleropages formosus]
MSKKSEKVLKNTMCWELKRYGRFVPKSAAGAGGTSWRIFDNTNSAGKVLLTVVESGHLLVSQDQELLEGFSLADAPSFLKVSQKSDILLFQMMVKGEGRMFRVQFAGASKAETLEQCKSAASQLQKYVPVSSQQDTPPPHGNMQPTMKRKGEAQTSPQKVCVGGQPGSSAEVAQGSLSLQRLAQCFLGQGRLSLPLAYHHQSLPTESLESFLRLCLLDHTFPSFVEQVEAELNKLAQN